MSIGLTIALTAIGASLLACVLYFLFHTFQQRVDALQNQLRISLDGNTQILQQQVALLTKQLDERLNQTAQISQEANKQIGQRLDNAAKVFGDLQNKLGKLDEANQKIYNVGKDISSLQEILKRPKARGSLGEFFLADLLAEMLPRDRFDLQYRFKSNEQVDAVVRIGDRLLPIDSKFPLENFSRLVLAPTDEERIALKKQFIADVKKHVDAIARKYILPEEGTFDFAFMYIPAENVFYEVIIRDDDLGEAQSLQEYSQKKRVIAVSPNSFYAYLGALMYALRGERMQKNVHEIIAQIRHLAVDIIKFREDFDKIGHHLTNVRGSYEASEKRLNRYQERLEKVHETETLLEEQRPVKLVQS
ncbi:MAG: DNA recombination protein RmuC [Deltaproteobacteria bacterium]|nr:DNA recombination protein RmuC [Deltaproteobacteria bacterium]